MNRREFIEYSSLGSLAALVGCKAKVEAGQKEQSQPILFDMHCHPGLFFAEGSEMYPGQTAFYARVNEMSKNSIQGFIGLVADFPLLKVTDKGIVFNGTFSEDEGWLEYKRQLSNLRRIVATSNLTLTTKPVSSIEDNAIGYIACEGGDFLGKNPDHLYEAYDDGVRSIQLVHYAPNLLGDLQTWKPEHGGLSSLGKEVVKKMNELHMIIDLAHASTRTVKMTVDLTTQPVILSHSILKDDRERPISARAISTEHAKLIADTGGIIGMWPSGFSNSFDEFVDHTFRMIDAVGIDHVGIGTDMDGNFQPVISNYDEFVEWKNAIVSRGLNREEADQVAGGNMMRVLKEVLI